MNTLRYAVWMKEEGFHVSLYCVAQTPLHDEAIKSNLTIITVRRNAKYFDVIHAWRVAQLFQQAKVDVCWFRDTRDMDLLGRAKRLAHGRFRLLYQQAMQFGVSKKDFFHTRRFAAIDAWVSTLDFLKQQVVSSTHFPNERIHVVPLGVDSSRILQTMITREQVRHRYGLADDAFVFGLMGRIDPLKGQHIAIEALRLVHEQGRKAHLLLVGESTRNEGATYYSAIQEQIRNAGLEQFVHVHPYTREVATFYKAIDVFLLCSRGETFGTVTVEAMACSVPIIGSRSSGTPELLGHGEFGALVTPDSANEFARAMLTLMNDYSSALAVASRASEEFTRRYSRESSVQSMREIVLSLVANR